MDITFWGISSEGKEVKENKMTTETTIGLDKVSRDIISNLRVFKKFRSNQDVIMFAINRTFKTDIGKLKELRLI